jgi:hypothetical protein
MDYSKQNQKGNPMNREEIRTLARNYLKVKYGIGPNDNWDFTPFHLIALENAYINGFIEASKNHSLQDLVEKYVEGNMFRYDTNEPVSNVNGYIYEVSLSKHGIFIEVESIGGITVCYQREFKASDIDLILQGKGEQVNFKVDFDKQRAQS